MHRNGTDDYQCHFHLIDKARSNRWQFPRQRGSRDNVRFQRTGKGRSRHPHRVSSDAASWITGSNASRRRAQNLRECALPHSILPVRYRPAFCHTHRCRRGQTFQSRKAPFGIWITRVDEAQRPQRHHHEFPWTVRSANLLLIIGLEHGPFSAPASLPGVKVDVIKTGSAVAIYDDRRFFSSSALGPPPKFTKIH